MFYQILLIFFKKKEVQTGCRRAARSRISPPSDPSPKVLVPVLGTLGSTAVPVKVPVPVPVPVPGPVPGTLGSTAVPVPVYS